jgi:Uma2 family endonuclease
MGTTTTLVTVPEFLAMPEPEGERLELIGGEIVSMSFGHIPHEVVKKNINKILVLWLAQNSPAELFAETMYHVDEHNALMPDLSVLFPGRIGAGSKGWIQGAPELAIEVVSSEPAARLETKVELYLAHGGKSVWAVYPERRVVRVFDRTAVSKKSGHDEPLTDPAVLPGFSIPTSAIFEGV